VLLETRSESKKWNQELYFAKFAANLAVLSGCCITFSGLVDTSASALNGPRERLKSTPREAQFK